VTFSGIKMLQLAAQLLPAQMLPAQMLPVLLLIPLGPELASFNPLLRFVNSVLTQKLDRKYPIS
jgi:hypothetical protein